MSNNFLISICIPTRNRADILPVMLDSIVLDEAFDEQVQVVVSDNASTDDTPEVVARYTARYPDQIKYNRNSTDITADYNFTKVMELADGVLLKLHNDYSMFVCGGLSFLKQIAEDNRTERPILFLSNGTVPMDSPYETIDGLDAFVGRVSNVMSWIGCYTLWRDQFTGIEDKNRCAALNFVQIDWLFRLIAQGHKVRIYNRVLTERLQFKAPQSGYNFFGAHIGNYLQMQHPYVASGALSNKVFQNDKIKIYRFNIDFAYKIFAYQEQGYAFDLRGSKCIWFKNYWRYPRFYIDFSKIAAIRLLRSLGLLEWVKKMKHKFLR